MDRLAGQIAVFTSSEKLNWEIIVLSTTVPLVHAHPFQVGLLSAYGGKEIAFIT
jgi:hypothetical protein